MTTPAGTITAPSSVQEQLDLLLQRIRAGNCKLDYPDADLLLRNSENAAVKEVVGSRQYVSRVDPSGSCTFFKAPSASKRLKDDWVVCKVSNSFALNSNKSGQPFTSMAAANEGVVKQSSTIEDKAVRARLQSSISVFSLVALPGGANPNLNPNPNPNLNPNPNPNPNRNPNPNPSSNLSGHRDWASLQGPQASWKWLDGGERLQVVNACVPDDSEPSSKRNEAFGTLEVEELLIKGVSIWDELQTLKEDMQQQRDSDFASGCFASGPSGSTHRADLGEWMEFCPEDKQPPRPGDVVECLGHGGEQPRISLNITHAAGGTIFVVSSDPAWAGNMPQDEASRKTGAVVAFLGRVPVAVHGDAPVNSFLVPSGLCNGTARAVGEQELRESPKLRSQCFGIVWANLPPDAFGRPMVLAFVSAHPQLPAFGDLQGVEQLAPLSSTLVPRQRPPSKSLRPYQEACVEHAIAEHTIINLGTGLGKTLIAVKVIDHFRRLHPGQHVLFVVPNNALVPQQAEAVRQDGHASPRVAELCGSTLDSWGAAAWEACLSANDVLLGTPQTFYNAIYTNGHVQLSQFSLFVFDECHEYATRGSER